MGFFKKNFLILSLILLISAMLNYAQAEPAVAEIPATQPSDSIIIKDKPDAIGISIENADRHIIKVSEPVKKVDSQLFETNKDNIQQTFQIQKKIDVDDIKTLWESTVERNSVIKFALKKLAMPPEQRRIHSSLMAKSISTLISGASILPGIFGLDSITSSASAAGGTLAKRIIDKKMSPKEIPLTDTELIQLAGLVEDLQNKLIKSYYDYKSSIEALKLCKQNILLQNRNYSNALNSKNDISIIASSALYDKELYNELRLKQQIKLDRLELERLAGPAIVSKLNLTRLAGFIPEENKASISSTKEEDVKNE